MNLHASVTAFIVLAVVQTACAEYVVTAGDDWIPFEYEKNIEAGSALDFSGFWRHEGPAGRYGWVKNVNGHFEFEHSPGIERRFVGANLCNEANYPDRALADELVMRFRRLGYNSIRIHHHDKRLFSKRKDGTTGFDEENARKLDYFLSRAFAAGMYVTTDLFVSRRVNGRDVGLQTEGKLSGHIYKCLLGIHDPVFEDWKTYAAMFLNRINVFTGRRYADEPGLPFLSLVNEGNLLWCWTGIRRLEPMKREWRRWIREKRAEHPGFAPGISEDCEQVSKTGDDPDLATGLAKNEKDAAGAAMIRFAADLEAKAAKREIDFVRSLGAKALITSLNGGMHYVPMQTTRQTCFDWVDTHAYVDHPQHVRRRAGTYPIKIQNLNWVKAGVRMTGVPFCRIQGMPFSVSEWNFAGLGECRSVGGLMMGALAAGQDWDALWRFAYSHGGGLEDRTGNPKAFDLAADPLNMASERAVLALFLRGDLKPFSARVLIDCSHEPDFPRDGMAERLAPTWRDETLNVGVSMTARPGSETNAVRFGMVRMAEHAPCRGRDGQVAIDREKGIMTVVTDRTAGGFATAGMFRAGPVAFDVGAVPTTAWVSALDGTTITQSRRLLLVHLTDVQGTGCTYADASRRQMERPGAYPPLARRGRLAVRLALEDPVACEVWALTTSGRRIERVPSSVINGRLAFVADVKGSDGKARYHYEICKSQNDKQNGGK